MIVDRVEVVLIAGRDRSRFGKARVIEPTAVPDPCDAGELYPVQPIRSIYTVLDSRMKISCRSLPLCERPYAASVPVSFTARAVSATGPSAFIAFGSMRTRRGAVRRFLHVEHRLVLKARVVREEVVASPPERHIRTRKVVELGQPLDEGVANRTLQARPRQLVLCLDPCDGLRVVGILEPSVRIHDADAMVILGHVGSASCGVRGLHERDKRKGKMDKGKGKRDKEKVRTII